MPTASASVTVLAHEANANHDGGVCCSSHSHESCGERTPCTSAHARTSQSQCSNAPRASNIWLRISVPKKSPTSPRPPTSVENMTMTAALPAALHRDSSTMRIRSSASGCAPRSTSATEPRTSASTVIAVAASAEASQRWTSTLGRLTGRTSSSCNVPEETSWPIAPAARMNAIGDAIPASGERVPMSTAPPSGNTVTMNRSPRRIGLVKRWRRNAAMSVAFMTRLPAARSNPRHRASRR